MSRVELLDPESSTDERVRSFARRVRRPDGSLPAHFAAEAHFPAVAENVYEARLAIAREGDLGTELFTKLAVAVSLANRCTYCTGAYATQLANRLDGHESVRAFQLELANGELEGRVGDVVHTALDLLDAPEELTDGDFERLRDEWGFTDRTFVELVYVVNVVSGYNRLTLAFDLPYDHEFPEEWADPASLPAPVGSDP